MRAGPLGLESTIVDFTSTPVLRRGRITAQCCRSCPNECERGRAGQTNRRRAGPDDPAHAQGKLTYIRPSEAWSACAADARSATAAGDRVGILAPQEDLSLLAPEIAARAVSGRIETIPYGSRGDLERSARELYASIRALDATGVTRILAIGVGSEGLARAIHDRLMRAADGRIKTGLRQG